MCSLPFVPLHVTLTLLLLIGLTATANYQSPSQVTLSRGGRTYLSCDTSCTVDVTLCFYGTMEACTSSEALAAVRSAVGRGVQAAEVAGSEEVFVGTCGGVSSDDLFIEYRCKC